MFTKNFEDNQIKLIIAEVTKNQQIMNHFFYVPLEQKDIIKSFEKENAPDLEKVSKLILFMKKFILYKTNWRWIHDVKRF